MGRGEEAREQERGAAGKVEAEREGKFERVSDQTKEREIKNKEL